MAPVWVKRLSLLNVVVNVMIVITGGAVRLTGSGLGCPSWPNCAPGTFHTTPELGIHGAIEWGNRLFGVVVGIVAVATLLAAWFARPRRKSVVRMAFLVAIGVPAQALIGFVTVETGLNPWVVSCHFLVTIGVLAAAFTGWFRSREIEGPFEPVVPRQTRQLTLAVVWVTFAVITIGVIVTGSGPHAGDPASPRIGLDPVQLSQAHADAVFLLLGFTVALLFTLKSVKAPRNMVTAAWTLLAVELGQGLIGFVQLFTGLPELLVGAHMLGAALLWLAALRVHLMGRTRLPIDDTPAHTPTQRTELIDVTAPVASLRRPSMTE
ncbi:COX15/CtaA family protein [Stackebrandtia soli]|uniref:COX15/CtaA family protein n=1 Tax=Stackebrandtia soli TaxID=1892856 RepID=UPI0039EC2451